MVRFFTWITIIFIVWLWIIVTWIHITIQGIKLNGYVYQPYKKYPSIVRNIFITHLYPFCCRPITDKYEIKLVPIWEAYKKLLLITLFGLFLIFIGVIEWERYRLEYHNST